MVPPTILSITPVNGATQLTPTTAKIVITFSEPMNQAAAQAAYVPIGGGPAGPAPTFTWNAPGTELTIDPKLTYPTATDPLASATPFRFTVTTAARDLAGNPLAADVNWQFSLLREITQAFRCGAAGDFDDQLAAGRAIVAGDDDSDFAVRGFTSYEFSALPDGIMTIESATLTAKITEIDGDPFGNFGNLLIQSTHFPQVDQAAFDAPPLHDLGTFIAASGSNAAGDAVSKDVLTAFKDDYANRNARENWSQYKLLFAAAPNSNFVSDVVFLDSSASSNQLTVKYLYP